MHCRACNDRIQLAATMLVELAVTMLAELPATTAET